MKSGTAKYRIKDICNLEKGKQIDTDLLDDSNKYKYINGGIQASGNYSEYNTIGKTVTISEGGASCGYVNYIEEPFWCGCHCYRLTEISINPRYLFFALKANQNQIMKLRTGSTMPNIKKSLFEEFELNLLQRESDQIRIVEILDKTCNIIDQRKRQIKYFDNLIKARFVEMFGDPVDNDHGWQTQTLDSVCKTIVDCPHSTPSYTNENTGYMCIRTSIVKKNHILWDEIEYIPEHEYRQRIQRKRPEKGDIVYTREGAILGIAAMIDRDCNVALGQRSMLLSPNASKCLPQFLCVAMNFDSFLRKALDGISGSASPHINVGDIKTFSIILPQLELQNQFADFVAQTDKSKIAIQKSLDETQVLFDSLMQEYFG